MAAIKHVRTPALDIAYEESGAGTAVILLHGFPYDPRAFDGMLPLLPGCRVIVPYLRGYGPTRFLSSDTHALGRAGGARQRPEGVDGCARRRARGARRLRLGRTRGLHRGGAVAGAGARARHLRRLQHARRRGLGEAGVGRAGASLLVSVLFPHRARPRRADGEPPRASRSCCGGSGRRTGGSTTRRSRRTRAVVRQSGFRRRRDPLLPACATAMCRAIRRSRRSSAKLAAQPPIAVPTIVLQGEAPGTMPPEASIAHAKLFTGPYQRRTLPRVGHNVPQEAPRETAQAVMELVAERLSRFAGSVAALHFANRSAPLTFQLVVNNRKEVIQCLIVSRRGRRHP